MSRVSAIRKRSMDLLACVALLPLAIPVCSLLCIVIRLETSGNPIFVQRRVGRGGRVFHLFKLRTMRHGGAHVASHLASGSQITRVGAFLRRTKLDELPQLVNVLLGSMSIIGPRPSLPSQTELIAERLKRGVLNLRPGITGPAQIAGIDMSEPRRLAEADSAYLRSSLCDDVSILWQTAIGKGSGDAVTGA